MRTYSEDCLKRISEALSGIKKELSDINRYLKKLSDNSESDKKEEESE